MYAVRQVPLSLLLSIMRQREERRPLYNLGVVAGFLVATVVTPAPSRYSDKTKPYPTYFLADLLTEHTTL